LDTVAATDALADKLDARQYELQEGPCYEAVTNGPVLVSFDLRRDARWPRYGPVAADHGAHAQLAVLLTSEPDERAALNLYASQAHEFDAEGIELAETFASHASLAMGFMRTMQTVSAAIGTREMVGKAIGVVMERYQIDSGRAFAFLVRTSQHSNVKLRDVAAQIVAGHDGRTTVPPSE
jgi:hypothetical protein